MNKIKYFLDAWEMNGVGKTVATVQDGPGTVVTLTVDDLRSFATPSDALYTMDQMRDYAEGFHRSRVEAGLSEIKGMSKKIPGDFLGNPANNPTLARKLGYNDALKDVLAVLGKKPTEST
jgi:hypothetical protein